MQRLLAFTLRTPSRLIWVLFTLVLMICLSFTPRAHAETEPGELAKAVEAIENLDLLRHGLASSLESRTKPPTGETFKAVCKPVGMQAKQLSQEHGWQVKQIASKYRNPDHAPDSATAEQALERFAADPQLYGYWNQETLNGVEGTRYYRRINVEASCLTCHGAKENRPDFVKAKYPQDLAYNFEVGDLRGMYAVFIPDLEAELAAAYP
ncbi:MAG: DUF3365 domain-containing protein [Synechococcaceae cyanobacterium SM2_3_1]|nr:DUF3365 domain-containing protein [Synechococcaceae cyanobacterium SM2_3_1]